MNILRRSMLCIVRDKGRSLSLWLVMLAITAGVTAAFGVQKAVDQAEQAARAALNASFRLRGEPDAVSAAEFTTRPVTISEIEAVMEDPAIRSWNAVQIAAAAPEDVSFPSGRSEGTLFGVTSSQSCEEFRHGSLSLTRGSHISPKNRFCALISEEMARENDLRPGSLLLFREQPVRIAGVYAGDTASEFDPDTIFMDHAAFWEATGAAPDEYTGWIEFFVTDPDTLNAAAQRARDRLKQVGRDPAVQTVPGQQQSALTQLTQVRWLSGAIGIGAAGAGMAVLFLVLSLRLRARAREIGILSALGIPRWQIFSQFAIEAATLLVAAQAAALPVGAGLIRLAAAALPGSASVGVTANEILAEYAVEFCAVLLAVGATSLPLLLQPPRQVLRQSE